MGNMQCQRYRMAIFFMGVIAMFSVGRVVIFAEVNLLLLLWTYWLL